MHRLPFKRPYNHQRPRGVPARGWYEIRNADTDTARLSIYDEIGGWGTTAAYFLGELSNITARAIDLHLNSPGGDVFDGLAILNALRQHPADVTVTVDGIAASAASFIAMSGQRVMMAPNAMMMIHDAAGYVVGNAADMTAMGELLDKTSDNIAGIYSARAGGEASAWRAAMLAETWYTDTEAVAAGLADGILGAAAGDEGEDEDMPPEKMPPGKASAAAPTGRLSTLVPVMQDNDRQPTWGFDLAAMIKEECAA